MGKKEIQSPEQCREIQLLELKMYEEIRKICEKHNIRYYGIAGTCLGAVRHKGFIPWDDDIDLGMPYEDYKRFREIARTELPAPYEMMDQMTTKHAKQLFLKIHDSTTTGIPYQYLPYPDRYMGISIDIMPIYGTPKGKLAQKITAFNCFRYRVNNQCLRFPFKYQKTRNKFFVLYWILFSVHRLFLPYNYYAKKGERKFSKYPFDNSDMILYGWRGPKEKLFYYEDFAETIEVPFENIMIPIPKGYDRYLTREYGDYMKLPPKEKQFSHVWGKVDLHKSYKDFKA